MNRQSARVFGFRSVIPILLLFTASAARAQTRDDPAADTQIWPDTQVSIKLDKNYSLLIHGTIRLGRNNSAFVNEQIGVALRRSLGKYLSGQIGYRFINSEPTPTRQSQENRVFLELSPRFTLAKGIVLNDRNRVEWRDIRGRVTYRYRNRVQFERPFNIAEKRVTPYISAETYYDSRFRAWNRSQYFAGMRVPVTRRLTIDGFYMRQIDDRTRPGFLHVFGTFLRVEL